MTLFLVICVAGVIFFLVFLVQCSRPGRKSSFSAHGPVIHKIPAAKADVSNVDRLLFVHLEREMADFASSRGNVPSS